MYMKQGQTIAVLISLHLHKDSGPLMRPCYLFPVVFLDILLNVFFHVYTKAVKKHILYKRPFHITMIFDL